MAHNVSNINVRGRLTQVIVLVVLILGCMLISQFAHAQKSAKKIRYDHPKFRIALHSNSAKAVKIMHKKRISENRTQMYASSRRKEKSAVMAETDGPTVASN